MMRTTICRTLATSTIKIFKIKMVDNTPTIENLPDLIVSGKVTEKDAFKILREKYGKNHSITIGSIDVEENTYEISVEDFLKYATKVEKVEKEN